MMRRRYDAYRSLVVRPFFRDHFARLDRQVVLVDALAAFNAGPEAVRDLERALAAILDCFRVGRRTLGSALIRPRIDKVLFAATKADHLHHAGHDRLEAILARMMQRAIQRAGYTGAAIDVIALAAVRATREAQVRRNGESLPSIIGVPAAGETVDGEVFDGIKEVVAFPGDLPENADDIFGADATSFRGLTAAAPEGTDFRFLRFRPAALTPSRGESPGLPHIRLDRALQFLIGDWLQ
jgi:predicted YcjX-like family ATPase